MAGARIRLEDLPPAYRAQALAQLGGNAMADPPTHSLSLASTEAAEVEEERAEPKRRRGGSTRRGVPNKTEALFNIEVLGGSGQYERLFLYLPGGSRYCPDFMQCIVDPQTGGIDLHLYEVKGTYRLESQGRALTAFKEARAAFPFFRFHWYERKKGGGWEEKYRQ